MLYVITQEFYHETGICSMAWNDEVLKEKVNIPNVKLLWVNFVGWNLAEEVCV